MVINNNKSKGRLTTCRYCKYQFKISEELKQEWYELKNPCPKCKTLNCTLPPTEKKLQELQTNFYENGKLEKDLSILYENILKYSRSICLKMLSKKLKDADELDYFAHKTSWKVVEQYIRIDRKDKKEFRINDSFAGYIAFKIQESFFEKEEHDCANESISDVTFDDSDDYDGNFKLAQYDFSSECSKLTQVKLDIENEEKNTELQVYFNSVIESGELKLLVAVLNYIKFGENKSDLVFQHFGNEGKGRFIYLMKQFRNKLSTGYFA